MNGDESTLSQHLSHLLEMAISGAVGAIEALPSDQDGFIPMMLLEKAGKYDISVVSLESNAEAVRAARVIIQQQAQTLDAFVLSYSVQQPRADGTTALAIMLETGERGIPFTYRCVQPFSRTDRKVELLTDKPIVLEKSSALI
jgi:hypothetical protein